MAVDLNKRNHKARDGASSPAAGKSRIDERDVTPAAAEQPSSFATH
jgi:hypothetical protein